MSNITTHVELNTQALKQSFYSELRVFYWLKKYDTYRTSFRFSGLISHDEFFTQCKYIGIKERQARRILNNGIGIFWNLSGNLISLRSPEKLAHNVGIDTHKMIQINIESMWFYDLQKFKAKLYETLFYSSTKGKTISRETITKITGISKKTQLRYEKIVKIKKTFQYEEVSVRDGFKRIPNRNNGVWKVGETFVLGGTKRDILLVQQPNFYQTKLKSVGYCVVESKVKTTSTVTIPLKFFHESSKSVAKVINTRKINPDGVMYCRDRLSIFGNKSRILVYLGVS